MQSGEDEALRAQGSDTKTGVLVRRGENTRTTGRGPREDGDREQGEALTSQGQQQGLPGANKTSREKPGRTLPYQGHQAERGPADTLLSDF